MFRLILKMAWKNSFARPSRTLLLVVMIAVSMSMMLGIQGLYDGMAMNMADKNKRSDSGDISIFAKDYRINRDISYRIKNADEIRGELNNTPEVEAVVLRVSADGLASTARKSSFAQIRGIDLQEEENFGAFSEFLKQGKMEFGKRGAIVGIELAKTLKLKVGSKVVFSTQDSNGEINSMALKVDAIVQTTNIVLDTSAIYIDLEKLRTFLGLMSHEATQIVIKTENIKLYERLKSRYSSLDVKSFFELQPMMKMMEEMMVIFNSITFFIVMSVVFVGIFGVMYVSVLDRIREFGIMLSIGMQYKYIRLQIFLEAIVVGLLGFLSGAVLGLFLLIYLKDYGLDFSAFADALEMWGYETIIHGTIKLSYFTTTFLAIMSASVLSVLIPLRKIKKLNPIEVIKADK
ncbi:ABC-type transport system, involved in lipoprotein release, permease component [Epsilonproteobacteria bacterium SCGC AD-311-C15]|jgi:ABC-type lipoprotein release transport system permease subunit|nr:ABC-type transport system, involved in lipoprotein release, permease component [Epsilonproteobacteria bacterium SCGC AD-311-C15]